MRKEFYTGHLFDVYRYFGAHKEGENFIFRVFAPSAKGEAYLESSVTGQRSRCIRRNRAVYMCQSRFRRRLVSCISTAFTQQMAEG